MRKPIEPRDPIYVKGYGFLSFAKSMKKYLKSKYGKKLRDTTKKLSTNYLKTASKKATQKTTEATSDLVWNNTA